MKLKGINDFPLSIPYNYQHRSLLNTTLNMLGTTRSAQNFRQVMTRPSFGQRSSSAFCFVVSRLAKYDELASYQFVTRLLETCDALTERSRASINRSRNAGHGQKGSSSRIRCAL